MKPKVSIIVPVYNIEEYIDRCLGSLISQTLKDIEIIIVNDGSTDNGLNIIRKFASLYTNIKFIDGKNEGVVIAREKGLKIAQGDYVLFVDGDDWLEKEAIEVLYENAITNNSDIVLYNSYWGNEFKYEKIETYNSENNLLADPLKSLFLGRIMPSLCFKLIKRIFILKNILKLPYGIKYGEDLATSVSLFIYNPRLSLESKYLYNYYYRQNSVTKSISERMLDIDLAMLFITNELKDNNLYDKYKNEFESLIFNHMFLDKVYNVKHHNELHKKIYKQFKSKRINILRNKYILKKIKGEKLSSKIRLILFNYNFNLGKLYDRFREICKS